MKHIHIYILVLLHIACLHARDYYVSPTGSGTAATDAQPSRLAYALARVAAGDRVLFKSGIYRPQSPSACVIEYTGDGGESETKQITFTKAPGNNPIFKPYVDLDPNGNEIISPSTGTWNLIKIYPRLGEDNIFRIPKYITIDGLELEGNRASITDNYNQEKSILEAQPGRDGYPCPDGPDSDQVPDGCEYVRYNGQGILVTGPFMWDDRISILFPIYESGYVDRRNAIPHHITVKNCYIHDFASAGLSFQRCDYITVDNCIVSNNCWYTIFGSSGINFYQLVAAEVQTAGINGTMSYDHTVYRNKVTNNICYGNMLKVLNQNLHVRYDGNGIIIDDFTHEQDYGRYPWNNINRGNVQYQPYKGRTLVANNIIYGNGGSGIKVYSSQYTDVFHNTLYNNGIGDYKYANGDRSLQQGLLVQSIVNEDPTVPYPKPPKMPGYNNVFNNISYNTITYPGLTAYDVAYKIALDPNDFNTADHNFINDPSFTQVPTITVAIPQALNHNGINFKPVANSPVINYGVYRSEMFLDKDRIKRDMLGDAGAYEASSVCIEKIVLGSASATIPANQSNNLASGSRTLHRAQKSITYQGVFVTQAGAVLAAEVDLCNNTPVPVPSGGRTDSYDEASEDNTQQEEHKLAYPNPISQGKLNFSTTAAFYQLFDATGALLRSGNESDHLSIEGLHKGVYILYLDGKAQKIIIE